ncbi:hypothetical protein Tco_0382693, partial [Tanacetum coccineum]
TMAEENVLAQAPTRTNEQILPRSAWLQIRKSNLLLDIQKMQNYPIFQISVGILQNTNFFRDFSASASVPAIYIQQFWNTMTYDVKTGIYNYQLDEQWFNLNADLLRKALEITLVDPPHPFESPPDGEAIMDFMALNNAQTKTNSSAFRSMLEKHQLSGPNFNEWLRALKLVVRTEKLQYVFETPLPPAPAASADNQVLADWNTLFDRHNEVACLILGTMSPKLYQQFENKSPQEMITELQKMYGKPPGVELQELVNMFHSCKQAEGQSISDHVLLMKSYLDQLATLNYAFPDKVSINFILNLLLSEFQAFVQNYNMQSIEKTISEVYSLLIEFEKSIKRNKQQIVGVSSTPHVMAIQSGRVQKNKSQGKAKGKEKGHGKELSFVSSLVDEKEEETGGQNVASPFQGLRGAKKLKRGSLYLYVGNGVHAEVEAIGSFDLVLPNGLIIVLDNCHYAPSITRELLF